LSCIYFLSQGKEEKKEGKIFLQEKRNAVLLLELFTFSSPFFNEKRGGLVGPWGLLQDRSVILGGGVVAGWVWWGKKRKKRRSPVECGTSFRWCVGGGGWVWVGCGGVGGGVCGVWWEK